MLILATLWERVTDKNILILWSHCPYKGLRNIFQFNFFLDRCFRGEIRTAQSQEWNTSDLTARLAWINWDNLGIEPGRRGVLANLQLSGHPHMQHMGLPPPGLHPGVHPHHHPGYHQGL